MKSKLTPAERLALIKRVLEGEPISKVVKEFNISRVIFHRWLKKYKKYGEVGIKPKAGGRPKKRLSTTLSLKRTPKKFRTLSPHERLRMVEEVIKEDKKLSEVAKKYEVSRNTIYKWIKRYKSAPSKRQLGVEDKERFVERYYRQSPKLYEDSILSLVEKHPEYGIRSLVNNLPKIGRKPILGHHGVQNILRRYGLSTYDKRKAYSEGQVTPVTRTITEAIGVATRFFTLPFKTRSRIVRIAGIFALSTFSTVVVLGLAGYLVRTFITVSGESLIGLSFATLALLMGSLFFLYSLKYYITLAVVLSFSQTEQGAGHRLGGASGPEGKRRGILNWLLGLGGNKGHPEFISGSRNKFGMTGSTAVGLTPNLDNIQLKRHPYVSIHIPFYNEKYVTERAIAAATSFDYPNYEVILCDDSTDETTLIIKDYMRVNGGKWMMDGGESPHTTHQSPITSINGDGYTLTQTEVRPGVTLKHLHRTSRSGFKGGALKLALKHTDPRTEFVSVFDADFVPYPDTLELFLKYFQAVAGTLDFKRVDSGKWMVDGDTPHTTHQSPITSRIAAVQGYQWHVLNKSENWITRGVRSEYAGSYVIERSGTEIYGGLKQISGAVYMIRRDVLEEVGWEESITEDFQLTLKLYEAGYKVVYTPYIQAPAECVSTLKRLIRQRMRWAEGHSNNIRKMFVRLLIGKWEKEVDGGKWMVDSDTPHTIHHTPITKHERVFVKSPLTLSEKLEFLYLSPYYLQAFFFLVGTFSWLISETIFAARLPFWTSLWGWSLVLTNMLSLPLLNAVGLFLEESEERDYQGLLSFVALTYILVPFQAYAALKGFLQKKEGPWFRTPKTGRITDVFTRGRFYRFISGILPGRTPAIRAQSLANSLASNLQPLTSNLYLSLSTANNRFQNFKIRPKEIRWVGNLVFVLLISFSLLLATLAPFIPRGIEVSASTPNLVQMSPASDKTEIIEDIEEITVPKQFRFETGSGEILEMIFHREPRVRIKLGTKELDITSLEVEGIGKINPKRSIVVGRKEVRYEEVVPGIDLVYTLHRKGFNEEFIIKKPLLVTGVKQKFAVKEVDIIGPNPETFGIYDDEEREVFRFGQAFLKEEHNQDIKNTNVTLSVSKTMLGYEIIKNISEEGRSWMASSERVFPVILDPPVTIIASGYNNAEAEYAGIQRKLVFMETRDRYYTVSNDNSSIQLWISDNNTGSSWTQLSDLDDDNDDHNPTVVADGDDFWVAWNDNSSDNPQFRRITTDASSETYEAVCTGPDMGAVGGVDVNTFGIASTYLYFYNDNDPDVYRITKSEYPGSCSSADFTSITNTSDGPTAGGEGALQVTTGDELHAVWRTTSGMRHGIYSGSGWNASAPFTINSFNSDEFSLVKDASNNLYVSAEAAVGEVHVYRCSATCTGSWTDLGTAILDTDCDSGYSDITMHSLTYDSTNNDLILFVIATDATNERACFRVSSDMGSNWESTTWDLGYTSTALSYISSVHTVSDPSKAAVTLRDNGIYSFATVPESMIFLALLPFVPGILGRFRKKMEKIYD